MIPAYRPFTVPSVEPRAWMLARKRLDEALRLCADPDRLLSFYPALRGRVLVDPFGARQPYLPWVANPADVRFRCLSEPYRCHPALSVLQVAVNRALGSNSTCMLHVCGWTPESVLTLSPADYTDIAATNLLADLNLPELGADLWHEPQPTLRLWDIARSECRGDLPSPERSGLVNPMGVAGLILTVDGFLTLAHRSRRVSTYADRLGPSASGYVEWADVQACSTDSLNDLMQSTLRREMAEELRLNSAEIDNIAALGLYRELYRAGLGQGFYAVTIRLTADELFERAASARDRGEFAGMAFVPANEEALRDLLAGKIPQMPLMGLEARGLASAFVSRCM